MFSKTVCRFYNPSAPSSCKNGSSCPFRHVEPENITRTITSGTAYTNQMMRTPNMRVHVHGTGRTVIDPKYKYVAPSLSRTSVDSAPSNEPSSATGKLNIEPTKPEIAKPREIPAVVKPFEKRKSSQSQSQPDEKENMADVYTKEGQLSEEDIAAYEASEFVSFIPLLPPTELLA